MTDKTFIPSRQYEADIAGFLKDCTLDYEHLVLAINEAEKDIMKKLDELAGVAERQTRRA